MTKSTPIEDHWRELAKNQTFCCDAHKEEARLMFFTGAMAALHALTGWDPEVPGLLCVNALQIAAVTEELTTRWNTMGADAELAASQDAVRH